MIYSTGTISLNGNIATGNGSNWTAPSSQVRQGQVLIVLSTPVQLFQINAVNSATELTVSPAAAAPLNDQEYGILVSDAMSIDGLAQAMSQLINEYDENIGSWEAFALTSAAQDITVTINGQQLSIPSIGKLKDSISKKADKDALEKKADLVSGAVPVTQGGTGATDAAGARTNLGLKGAATRDVGKASGTVAAGDDSRLNTIDGKTGGAVTDSIYVKTINNNLGVVGGTIASTIQNTIGGTSTQFQMFSQLASGGQRYGFLRLYQDTSYKDWYFDYSGGVAYAPVGWSQASDRRVKDKITRIPEPLAKMRKISGNTWVRKDDQSKGAFGMGFIAQEVAEVFPEAVSYAREGCYTVDGKVIDKPLALSPGDVAAALHHESLLSLMDILKSALEVIADSTSDTETREKLSAIAALIPEAGTAQKDSAVENQ
ncbi:tail fiber domain-containing protein [Franconibacter helveticus 513]|uniref:tail fiber domain-containing protein n=1 Tax=Franconibacter helveticus TaxID=357240 RepID=UPI0004024734|nr:tail fiber domain-containing protein [Franconibacter helveticus]